jgi:hypothetical protein
MPGRKSGEVRPTSSGSDARWREEEQNIRRSAPESIGVRNARFAGKIPLNAVKNRFSLTVQDRGPVLRKSSCKLSVPSCKDKNRCALKSGKPADRCEDNVVRQRSSVPAAERINTRSRNKFGMTVLGDYENVTYRHPQETRPSGRTVIRSHAVHLGSWFFVQNSVMNSFQHPGRLTENITFRDSVL